VDLDRVDMVTLTEDNIESEHICCAFSSKKNVEGYQLKKAWLAERLVEGFVFRKFDVRGKVFIEYVPAEYAWRPIDAPGYTCIQCFWVAGRFKGHGLGARLLQSCIEDAQAQGKHGVVVVTGRRKKHWMTDKRFFEKYGFEVCDTAPRDFELLVKRFDDNEDAPQPRFRESAKRATYEPVDAARRLVFLYTHQCPFTIHYVDEMMAAAEARGIASEKIELTTREAVQNGPSPFGVFGVFYDGEFLTHELMTQNKFGKYLLNKLGSCGRSPDRATAGTVRRPARASLPRFIEMILRQVIG